MTAVLPVVSGPRKPLRLWPGVVLVLLQLVSQFAVPVAFPEAGFYAFLFALACGLGVAIWWLGFSRARWVERVGVILLMIVGVVAASRLVHPSIANGMMGMMLIIYAIPVLSLVLVLWAVSTARFSDVLRRGSIVASVVLACGVFTLLRTGGITGSGSSDLKWRWTQSPEDRLLSKPSEKPAASGATAASATKGADWPGFRGAERDGVFRGARIETNWSRFAPAELWRRPIGPGWSSFAVGGDLFYTQEQRGEEELVSCYRVATGEPVWRHADPARFWESNAGAGPRATPTLSNGRVYTFGATGILNALDPADGHVLWSRDAAAETKTKIPGWGFSSSPLVIDDVVIVAVSGTLAAYEIASGKQRWLGPRHGGSYSSPHRATLGGVVQVLLLSGAGITSVAPGNGTVFWEHLWNGVTIVQPALIGDADVLITTCGASGGIGTRRLSVAHSPEGWSLQERWTSSGLKPYFNDLVIHNGHAFGFDNSLLACIDLEDGKRKWKGGRYGNGQLVLLPEQNVLLVLSEQGELALVAATPQEFVELARWRAIKGKTWNHPVVIGDVLLVRNGEEMAAFRLALASR